MTLYRGCPLLAIDRSQGICPHRLHGCCVQWGQRTAHHTAAGADALPGTASAAVLELQKRRWSAAAGGTGCPLIQCPPRQPIPPAPGTVCQRGRQTRRLARMGAVALLIDRCSAPGDVSATTSRGGWCIRHRTGITMRSREQPARMRRGPPMSVGTCCLGGHWINASRSATTLLVDLRQTP